MNRHRRRTVCVLDCLEGRLALSAATVAVVLAPQPACDIAVYGSVNPGDVCPDPASGPGLGDPTDPGSNDGQLPFLPLAPAPLNLAGPA